MIACAHCGQRWVTPQRADDCHRCIECQRLYVKRVWSGFCSRKCLAVGFAREGRRNAGGKP